MSHLTPSEFIQKKYGMDPQQNSVLLKVLQDYKEHLETPVSNNNTTKSYFDEIREEYAPESHSK